MNEGPLRCHNCGAAYPPPTTATAPHLKCRRCDARLFAWLGDPFGQHDLGATHDTGRGGNQLAWVLGAGFVIFVSLCWFCRLSLGL